MKAETGRDRVNWVGHSLGGMLMFAHLETSPEAWRIANFVGDGRAVDPGDVPADRHAQRQPGPPHAAPGGQHRADRPADDVVARLPGLAGIDQFYYTVGQRGQPTVDRGSTATPWRTPAAGALQQLDPYLETRPLRLGRRRVDYAAGLGRVATPVLMIAGDGDVMSDVASTRIDFRRPGPAPTRPCMRFGRADGHADDYGHCDLVWSRYAAIEVFPPLIDWLDRRQPGVAVWPSPSGR